MKYPPMKDWEVLKVIQRFKLLKIGLTYTEAKTIEYEEADALITLYDTIKEVEQEEMEKSEKKIKMSGVNKFGRA